MVENKKNGDSEVLNKFLEKLTRKLGEIAILIHLSQTPEGDHAYNIRGKASEILFQRKKKLDIQNMMNESKRNMRK